MRPYALVPLGGGVTAIEEGPVRMFLVRGEERALLIDTGLGGGDLRAQVEALWTGPLAVVNTHGHVDHVGADRQFPEVLAHPADWQEIRRNNRQGEVCLRPLGAGDRLDLGGRSLEIIETPGHTPGSIVLLDRERRLLFGGDNVSDRPVFLFLPGASLTDYLESLRRLAAGSGDYDVIYACHGTAAQQAGQVQALIACGEALARGELAGTPLEPYGGRARALYTLGSAALYYPPTA